MQGSGRSHHPRHLPAAGVPPATRSTSPSPAWWGAFWSTPASIALALENQRLFLGSADMMTRNTQRRVEVICPVYATHTKARLNHILDILLRDTVRPGALDSEGSYQKKCPPRAPPGLSSQDFFMDEAVRSCREVGFAARALPSGPLGGLLRRLRRRDEPPAVPPGPVFCAGFLPAVSLI